MVILEKFQEYYHNSVDFSKMTYKINKYDNGMERVEIHFGENYACPIYCICDGYYMMFYGDHGSFTFDCTWKTSIFNIPFNSPYYLFEKMDVTSIDRSAGKDFNSDLCKKEVLNYLYESDWYEELSDYDKSRIKGFITTDKWCPDIDDYKLSSSVDKYLVKDIRELVLATNDRYDFITTIRDIDRDESPFSECYELYSAGEEINPHYWFILRCLFEVVNQEGIKSEGEN